MIVKEEDRDFFNKESRNVMNYGEHFLLRKLEQNQVYI